MVELVSFNVGEGVIKAEEVGVGRDQARLDLHSRVLCQEMGQWPQGPEGNKYN